MYSPTPSFVDFKPPPNNAVLPIYIGLSLVAPLKTTSALLRLIEGLMVPFSRLRGTANWPPIVNFWVFLLPEGVMLKPRLRLSLVIITSVFELSNLFIPKKPPSLNKPTISGLATSPLAVLVILSWTAKPLKPLAINDCITLPLENSVLLM